MESGEWISLERCTPTHGINLLFGRTSILPSILNKIYSAINFTKVVLLKKKYALHVFPFKIWFTDFSSILSFLDYVFHCIRTKLLVFDANLPTLWKRNANEKWKMRRKMRRKMNWKSESIRQIHNLLKSFQKNLFTTVKKMKSLYLRFWFILFPTLYIVLHL